MCSKGKIPVDGLLFFELIAQCLNAKAVIPCQSLLGCTLAPFCYTEISLEMILLKH